MVYFPWRPVSSEHRCIDYDPQSVECARKLKSRYFPNDQGWTIQQGSVLDETYLNSLGRFDIVYAWGVLHHTGDMWKALENVSLLVKEGERLFVAIYNNQGVISRFWWVIKKMYLQTTKSREVCRSFTIGSIGLGAFPTKLQRLKKSNFYKKRGFRLTNLIATNGLGNNQFVFIKN